MVSGQAAMEQIAQAEREERLASAFEQQGNTSTATRLRNRASERREPAQNRLVELNVPRELLSTNEIARIGGSQDRERVVAQLRAQEERALELEREARARGDSKDASRYGEIRSRTAVVRGRLEGVAGDVVPVSFELDIGRARFPEKKSTELRSRFGSGEQQKKATDALQERRVAEREKERAGFAGTTGEFILAQREKRSEVIKGGASAQRLLFVASGKSQASQEQTVQAQLQLERQRQKVFTTLESGGNVFLRAAGPAEGPGQVLGIRTVEERGREGLSVLEQGVNVDAKGGLVFVKQGKKATAREVFKLLGAPEKEVIGSIEFGRQKKTVFKRKGLLPEVSIDREGEEVSRRSTITRSLITVPDANTARFAGFPTEQEGKQIKFPATFTVTQEEREDFPRTTVFAPITERFEKINAAGIELAGKQRVPLRGEPGFREFSQKPVGERLSLSVQDLGGRIVGRVQDAGVAIEKGGLGVERIGQQIQVREKGLGPAFPGTPSVGRFVEVGGQFVTEEGRIAQRSPVTFGAGEAVLVGTGFGAVSKGIKLVKASKAAQRATTTGKLLRGGVLTAQTAEVGLGIALTGAFGVQTVQAVSASERPGGELAKATNQVVGFGVGAKLGGKAVQASADVVTRIDNALFDETINLRTNEVFRSLKPEVSRLVDIGRRGEVGGRSARERAKKARPLNAGERAAQSRRQRQEKFLVSEGFNIELGQTKVKELRGQARERVKEPRLVREEEVVRRIVRVEQPKQFTFISSEEGYVLRSEKPKVVRKTVGTGVLVDVLVLPPGVRDFIPPKEGRLRPSQVPQGGKRTSKSTSTLVLGKDASKSLEKALRDSKQVGVQLQAEKNKGLLVTTEKKSSGKRANVGELGGPARRLIRLEQLPQVQETTLPVGFAQQRKEAGFFSPGSPEARRQGALERLRALRIAREEQIRQQLPQRLSFERDVFGQNRSGGVERVKARVDVGFKQGERFKDIFGVDARERFSSALAGARVQSVKRRAIPRLDQEQGLGQVLRETQLFDQNTASLQEQTEIQEARESGEAFINEDGGEKGRGRRRLGEFPVLSGGNGLRERPSTLEIFEPLEKTFSFGASLDFKRGLGAPGFQVLVKRRGSFELASSRVLTREQAIELGGSITDANPSQTFKLRETSQEAEVSGREPSRGRLEGILRKFKKLGDNTFREKQANLIDTAGEVRDISLKGVRASAQSRKQLKRLGL